MEFNNKQQKHFSEGDVFSGGEMLFLMVEVVQVIKIFKQFYHEMLKFVQFII